MRISKKEREELASIINGIHVAEILKRDFQEKVKYGPKGEEYEKAAASMKEWALSGNRLEIKLAEKYGIELPALPYARILVADADR